MSEVRMDIPKVKLPRVEGTPPTGAHVPLIERYRERLPFAAGDPLVSLQEGSTPLLRAPVLSEMVGATVRLKLEGANPTGSFKDRGMTCAVSAAVRDGAKAVICASTGNTAASAAAYAARAGITCAVIVPEGKIAQGKMAQTLVHGARVISLEGNFDQALTLVRELTDTHPIVLVNSVNEFRIEGQKTAAFEIHEGLEGGLEALCIPVGNAGNITSYWRGFREMGAAPRLFGFQAEGAAPLVRGQSRSSTRKRSPARSGSATRCAGRTRWPRRPTRAARSASVSDAEILAAYRLLASREGMFCEPASAASVAGLLKYGADGAEQIVCVLTGRGLKDPETAIANNDGRVIHLRGRDRPRSRKRCWVIRRRRACACPASSAQPRAPAFDCMAARAGAALELEVEETGEFAVETDLPVATRAREPVRAGVRAAASGRRLHLQDPLGDPARRAGWARAPRRSSRG